MLGMGACSGSTGGCIQQLTQGGMLLPSHLQRRPHQMQDLACRNATSGACSRGLDPHTIEKVPALNHHSSTPDLATLLCKPLMFSC